MITDSPRDTSTETNQTFVYFGLLTLLVYLSTPAGYLVDIQTSYMLKNQLHASATEISTFRLLTAIPVYFAFAFGLLRDRWNPLGLRDRGFFLIFAPITALTFIWMALRPAVVSRTARRDSSGDACVAVHSGCLSRFARSGRPREAHVGAAERVVECRRHNPRASPEHWLPDTSRSIFAPGKLFSL